MDNLFDQNVTLSDSIIRTVIGTAIIFSVLFLITAPWVALFSIYFIHTAIIRYDPVYALILKMRDNIRLRSKPTIVFHKKSPVG